MPTHGDLWAPRLHYKVPERDECHPTSHHIGFVSSNRRVFSNILSSVTILHNSSYQWHIHHYSVVSSLSPCLWLNLAPQSSCSRGARQMTQAINDLPGKPDTLNSMPRTDRKSEGKHHVYRFIRIWLPYAVAVVVRALHPTHSQR